MSPRQTLPEPVYPGRRLTEGAFIVVADVHGEPCAHGVLRRLPRALEVPGVEGYLGDIRVVQRVAHLFQDEPRRCLEVQG